jgi:hypothetical protein
MAPNSQTLSLSFADRKSTLDSIYEELKTKSSGVSSILVKIKSNDSFRDILSIFSSEIQYAVSNNVFTVLDLPWYIRHSIYNYVVFDTNITEQLTQKQIEDYYEKQNEKQNEIQNDIVIAIQNDIVIENKIYASENVSLSSSKESTQTLSPNNNNYQIYFNNTLFESNNTLSIKFPLNKNSLITNVMVTSTISGNHYYLPQREINKLATVFAYLPADTAGFKTIEITPSKYDSLNDMHGHTKAVTVTYTVPSFSSLASLP